MTHLVECSELSDRLALPDLRLFQLLSRPVLTLYPSVWVGARSSSVGWRRVSAINRGFAVGNACTSCAWDILPGRSCV